MIIINDLDTLKKKIKALKEENKSIGFVPTMGYLHKGHVSLLERARKENDTVVASIFVNPIQFGPTEDFEKYPRDTAHDTKVCREAGCDILFMPEAPQMYPGGFSTYVEVMGLTEGLCGASRPGHFKGVCTVVSKLFNLTKPDRAYFGQKDAQQLAVIKRMVQDLDMEIEVIGCPIVREPDGLAMSSRNAYLSENERQEALLLKEALDLAQKLFNGGIRDTALIKKEMAHHIGRSKNALIDYIEFVDSQTLTPVEKIAGETLVALAVKIGRTRLLDNKILNPL